MNSYHLLLILSIVSIWISVIISVVLVFGAIGYLINERRHPVDLSKYDDQLPTISIFIPCHNEEKVIASTLERVLDLNYPKALLQLIIINDNSSDRTADEINRIKKKYYNRAINVITTDHITGGKGKSNALNKALEIATGEWICVFDADAAPEKNTLKFLVSRSFEDERYGAVFGRNKARNRERNFLTKAINIELTVSQRITNPGKWHLFQLGQIPGTNFIVRRDIVEDIGGWDERAITEDTELGFSIMKDNYLIAYESRAEAYQQEPEKLSVYIKQRTRWAKGNLYVAFKNIPGLLGKLSLRVKIDILLYWSTYIYFLFFIIISDFIFVMNIIGLLMKLFGYDSSLMDNFTLNSTINFNVQFLLMYIIFVLQINVALASEKGQSTMENIFLSLVTYFTYSQLFILISLKALWSFIADKIFKREAKWYKTERF